MSDLPFNIVDGVVIALVILSALFAFFRGFTREVLSIAAWIGAIFTALYLYDKVLPYATEAVGNQTLALAIAAGAPFVVALLVYSILTHIIASRVQQSSVGPLDRTLGFAFGVLRALVLASVAYLVVVNLTQEPEDPTWMREAKTLPIVRAGAEIVFDLLPENLRSPEALDRLQAQGSAVLDGARAVEELAPVVAPALAPGNTTPPATPAAPGPQGALGTQDRTETGYTQDQVNDINSLVGRVGAGTSK